MFRVTPLVIIAAGKRRLSVRMCNDNVLNFFDLFVVRVVRMLHGRAAQIIRQKATSFTEPHVFYSQT